jgi:tetrahydromethanopterin S-methyltransferase subunit F
MEANKPTIDSISTKISTIQKKLQLIHRRPLKNHQIFAARIKLLTKKQSDKKTIING